MSAEIILSRFSNLSELQKSQIESLYPLYYDWNSKINVISRRDIENLYLHHVLHSMALSKIISFEKGDKVIDVGTGGGFPGIPLAILFPETHFTLCDSIAKKIRVVGEVANSIHLSNVTTLWKRAEEINDRYDYVISRGVSELKTFVPLVNHLYSKGILYLKGGDLDKEIDECVTHLRIERGKFTTFNINDWFNDDFFREKKIVFIKR